MPLDSTAVRRALADEDVRSISRRYFISNGFDGTLTSIGVAVSSFLTGVPDGLTVFKIGVGAAIGLGTSGVWSVWEIERAEKLAEIKELEVAMLTDLDETRVMRHMEHARAVNAATSGLGPIIGVLLPMLPYLVAGTLLSMGEATAVSVGVGVGLLFAFGAYMGSVASIDWRVAGLRMGLAGIVVAAITVLLPG